MIFDLGWNNVIPTMQLLTAAVGDEQGYCDIFNWFFSLGMVFTLVAVLCALIIRPLTRS